MIDRKFYLKDGDRPFVYVRADDTSEERDDHGPGMVEIGIGSTPVTDTKVFDLSDFNDLVVVLNEGAKFFGYELVMSPISIKKKAS